jgi:hypothetical protein
MRQAFALEEVTSRQTQYLRGMNRWLEVFSGTARRGLTGCQTIETNFYYQLTQIFYPNTIRNTGE